jgi:peroxiredoxin (alkyl hydroperoxide reductase subunit C)
MTSPTSPTPQTSPLAVGDTAPDFTLKDQNGQDTSLAQFRGDKNVVLVFYPFAFSGICTGELCEIRDNLGAFVDDDVQVLAISCDHMFSQRAWADKEGYFFPLLSDFWPHGEVSKAFGVFHEGAGAPIRGTFLIDREGVIQWSLVNEIGQARDFSGYHEALRTLR